MKYWNEIHEDAFSYFCWDCRNKEKEMSEALPGISVFSIIGSMIFGSDGKKSFLETNDNIIKQIFKSKELTQYKFYLLANIEITNPGSRIESYKKVWKLFQSKWQLEGFRKGPEIEVEISDKFFYSSVAEFDLENFTTALQIISNKSTCVVLASRETHTFTQDAIRILVKTAFSKGRLVEIDYLNLSLQLCPQGDIVFRWGDSSEEAELDLMFTKDIFSFFKRFI